MLDDRLVGKLRIGLCWEWTGSTMNGYGQVRRGPVPGRLWLVHRYVWECLVGPIPPGLELHHQCQNRLCCNPDHLKPVTRQEHVAISPPNQNVHRTHCRRGHPLTGRNLRIERSGSRRCRACWYETRRRYRARLKIRRAEGR